MIPKKFLYICQNCYHTNTTWLLADKLDAENHHVSTGHQVGFLPVLYEEAA